MKKTIFFILLIVICSCKRSNTNAVVGQSINPKIDTSNTVNTVPEIAFESIDTTEFIKYWELFRKAVLERNMATLSPMINDSLLGGTFLLREHNENVNKISKSVFMDSLYVLFTPEFLSLLKSYEIEKYIRSHWENILWEKKEKKTYKSYVDFFYYQPNEGKTDSYKVAYYTMSWRRDTEDENEVSKKYPENYVMREEVGLDFFTVGQIFIERDFERLDHVIFELMFVKNSAGIRLYSVNISYILSILSD